MEFGDHQEEAVASFGSNDFLVARPADHQGVGNALRAIFTPHAPCLPEDMAELLKRLG